MAWQLIQMAYLVSMPTFISCMEKEKGLVLLASVDLYFCQFHLNHFVQPFCALPWITSQKPGSQ